MYYNLGGTNCTVWECDCEDDPYCEMVAPDTHEELRSGYPYLDENCSPWLCSFSLVLCEIRDLDIEYDDTDRDSDINMDSEAAAEEYQHLLESWLVYLYTNEEDRYSNNDKYGEYSEYT